MESVCQDNPPGTQSVYHLKSLIQVIIRVIIVIIHLTVSFFIIITYYFFIK